MDSIGAIATGRNFSCDSIKIEMLPAIAIKYLSGFSVMSVFELRGVYLIVRESGEATEIDGECGNLNFPSTKLLLQRLFYNYLRF